MKPTDNKVQQPIEKIAAGIDELSFSQKTLIAGCCEIIIEQISGVASKLGIPCDVALLAVSTLIFNKINPQTEADGIKLFNNGYIQ